MKVYLAGPMRGIPEFNFPQFHHWAEILRNWGFEVFSPAEKGCEVEAFNDPNIQFDLTFRRKVFSMDTNYICNEADMIALLPGWETSAGARAEWALAQAIGIPAWYLDSEPRGQ